MLKGPQLSKVSFLHRGWICQIEEKDSPQAIALFWNECFLTMQQSCFPTQMNTSWLREAPPVCGPPTLLCVLHCTRPVCHSSLSHSGFCPVRWACSEAAWHGGHGKGVCVTLNKHRGRLAASRRAGLVSSGAPGTSCRAERQQHLHSPPSDALCVN